ncbi:glycosyltransferase family 4 protein [Pseudoduganella umbonata]|uniref:Alpha-1,3-rhamnosyl/mannosyltransferase n=1 Tax=Pseudoduganella umbonata TaxID=864828 RepID=A0A7W5E936_9BURK|nr:glycosyltransferase family 1 protein [Pseudoduganella umbonata]MBB3220500.1 alpha-1,3-rhamnosyl/mannosyltransferase [Pseudoduganella umbonata]
MTLKVGISATTTEPALTGGHLDGIGIYSRALLRELPRAGVAVDARSFGPAERLSVGRPMPRPFPLATLRDLVWPASLPGAREHVDVDLFHSTDYRIVRMDRPIVATLHDALPISHPEWCNPNWRGVKNWLQARAARKADHVIAHTHYTIAELVQCFGVDERRISVVPCGVDEEWLDAPDPAQVAATLARHGLRPGYFLTVGTLQPRKNIGALLQAYLGLPASVRSLRQLVIVGAAGARSEELVAQIKAAQQHGENVVWLSGLTSTDELRYVYAGAGIFVFPSLYEGFGIPVVEAFASGVPVVASNTTSVPEVTGGAAIDVDPLSVAAIGAAMLELARDEALRQRCIAAGRVRAVQLTWRETARKTAALYESVLKG